MTLRPLPTSKPWTVRALLLLLGAYQLIVSPFLRLLGAECRFHPSCSEYAKAAVQKEGALRGSFRALGRLLRCHPFHPGGFDPP